MQDEILSDLKKQLDEAKDLAAINKVKSKFLGRSGTISEMLTNIKNIEPEKRSEYGATVNTLKKSVEQQIKFYIHKLEEKNLQEKLSSEKVDITLPAKYPKLGVEHPISQTITEICNYFEKQNYSIVDGPEIEDEYHNFTALNFPENHPARDMQDTFYLSDHNYLRTHTSGVQIRIMDQYKPPIKIISPGRVYRCDSDATHTPMFHQIEGLVVAKDVSFAHLKHTLDKFLRTYFNNDIKIRYRPSFFPFTEPSIEVDIKLTSDGNWLEILGAGLVHPNVLNNCGIDPNEYSGFAFGMGIERLCMLRYELSDLRELYSGNLEFLSQFNNLTL